MLVQTTAGARMEGIVVFGLLLLIFGVGDMSEGRDELKESRMTGRIDESEICGGEARRR